MQSEEKLLQFSLMCHVDNKPNQSNFPPNIVLYIRNEIARRTAYKVELEQTERPPDFKVVLVARYKANCMRLEANMNRLTNDIIAITRRYFPTITIDPTNDEMTIAQILNDLPPPEAVITRPTLISSKGK